MEDQRGGWFVPRTHPRRRRRRRARPDAPPVHDETIERRAERLRRRPYTRENRLLLNKHDVSH